MILPGKVAIARSIVTGLKETIQIQPCGIDLTLRKVLQWTSAGTVDFSNQHRRGSDTQIVQFAGTPGSIHLNTGNYMVEFNEEVNIPLDVMGQVFVRSSLWRTGALLSAGVVCPIPILSPLHNSDHANDCTFRWTAATRAVWERFCR